MNKSRHIIIQEIKGYITDDKMIKNTGVNFQWKVRITPIKSNLNGELPAGCNSTEARLIR